MSEQQSPLGREKLKNERINLLLKGVITFLFIAGAGVFSYPFVADAINNFHDQLVIDNYQNELKADSKAQQKKRLTTLQAENKKRLAESKLTDIPGIGLVNDPFKDAVKDVDTLGQSYFKQHTIGAIFIPAIHVSLPVFDETNAALLDKGATVLQGTSFPIGGRGSHAVITGHSGLPDKKLFTDLDKLKKGDLFYIEVSGQKLAYQVDHFKTVLPTELDSLKIVESSDLVTLITCTPYMINTHRLLVTGVRVPFVDKQMEKQINQVKGYHIHRLMLFTILFVLVLGVLCIWIKKLLVNYLCIKHNYDFVFYVRDAAGPLIGEQFYLMQKSGQQVLSHDGNRLLAVSDATGQVTFKALSGGKYVACAMDEKHFPKVQGHIKQLKASRFTLKTSQGRLSVTGKQMHKKYWIDKR